MIQVIDLLYKTPSELEKTPNQEESMQHLLLAEVINGATVNPSLQKQIYDLISVPEPNAENIIWRKEILADFIANPSLLDDVLYILKMYDEVCKSLVVSARSGSGIISKKELTHRDSLIFKMRALADGIVKTLELYENAVRIFANKRLMSEAFVQINEYMKATIRKPEFEELKHLASELSDSITLDTSYIFIMKLSKYFCIEDVSMLELDPNPYDYESPKKRKAFDGQAHIENIGFEEEDDTLLKSLVERSISKLSLTMEHIINELKMPFEKINKGIYFYRFGIHLDRKIREMGLPVCLPQIDSQSKNRFECKDACDLWLSLSLVKKDKNADPSKIVVPNDIMLEPGTGALVITGKNNAGKTVFLRTIGIIQALAQAGLPVPATECYISPVHGLYAYFTAMDTGKGRFEEEVKSVSSMLDIVKDGDMVLLNEAFQSTAFDEAAEVLCSVMLYGEARDFRCIAVTHLPDIKLKMTQLEREYAIRRRALYAKAQVDEHGESTHKIEIAR